MQRLTQPLGFTIVGIAAAEPTGHADFIRNWLADGKHGQMHYLGRHLEQRLDPSAMLPGAKSIICVADRHATQAQSPKPQGRVPAGRIARYAWGDDYHTIIKKRLFELADALRTQYPTHEFRAAVDTAPILEREHAARAGLGWVGKHTLLIHPKLGSYLLLGEIVTTLVIQASSEAGLAAVTDHCGTCTRCIDACPTYCISPYQLDAARCISYLTIEHRDAIDPSLHNAMGDWITGCDVCQQVCPFNRDHEIEVESPKSQVQSPSPQIQNPHAEIRNLYAARPPAPAIRLLDVLNWDAKDRQKAFARSALKRIKLDMLKRNALIAAGNYLTKHNDSALRQRIETLAANMSEPE
ncbi:MAG: tRNA epoxyqueuosine(34) reductase QueG, partial [Phycisphaeraceae bacterium]